jgi:pimeloyl-[acyl-carrier protein] methyl ester esterase
MLKFFAGLAAALALAAPAVAAPDANKLFADSKVEVRDRFSVEVTGKGPDVVLIPGLSSSRATWQGVAERLRKTHRVHLIQIAGFAGEPARANAEGEVFAPTAEAIDAYIVQKKLGPATVVGHSLGGSMAIYLAQKHPDHVKKVMVVDSVPFLGQMFMGARATPESVKPMATQIRDGMAKGGDSYAQGLKQQIARMAVSDAHKQQITDWGRVTDPSVAGRAFYELITLDQRPGLAAMTTPVTVIYPDNAPAGTTGAFMDSVYGAAFKLVPTHTMKRVDASLHFVMFDQPDAFAQALDAFLAGS